MFSLSRGPSLSELLSPAFCRLLLQSCLTLWDPMEYIAHQAPLSMGFSSQEYWSRFPFLSPGNLPNSGTEPMLSYVSCVGRWVLYLKRHLGS